jgi:hypothetical protein
MSSLEEKLQQLIYEKRDVWFATENIELDDIQNAFIPILKIFNNEIVNNKRLSSRYYSPVFNSKRIGPINP